MSHKTIFQDDEVLFHHTVDLPPHNNIYGMHVHEIYEIFYLVSGSGKFVVEGNTYPLTPGALILLRSNEAHHIVINQEERYERIVLHFYPDIISCVGGENILLKPFDRPIGYNNLLLPTEKSGKIIKDCLYDIIESCENEYERKIAIKINLLKILYEIKNMLNGDEVIVSASENVRMNEILGYINENLFEELSVEMLCKNFFISKSQLTNIFKQYAGTTVWRYIISKRLIYAKNLIRSGTSASEAAKQCGFSDYTSFYRAYRKYFGKSPTEEKISKAISIKNH